MRLGRAVQLAWAAFAVAVAVVGAAVVLAVANVAAGSAGPDAFGLAYALIALTYGLVGLVVVTRRPDNRVGWLFCVLGLPSGLSCLGDQYGRLALVTRPGWLPGGAWAAWIGDWAWLLTPLAFPFLLLIFPDGRLPTAPLAPSAVAVHRGAGGCRGAGHAGAAAGDRRRRSPWPGRLVAGRQPGGR
jgi:two-component system NarL family sensor kinase